MYYIFSVQRLIFQLHHIQIRVNISIYVFQPLHHSWYSCVLKSKMGIVQPMSTE